jgi:hypothetical protein
MADEPDQTTPEDEDRLVIPLDPEEAVRAFLKVDPKDLPPDDDEKDDSQR